jgi:hypothetical protein
MVRLDESSRGQAQRRPRIPGIPTEASHGLAADFALNTTQPLRGIPVCFHEVLRQRSYGKELEPAIIVEKNGTGRSERG